MVTLHDTTQDETKRATVLKHEKEATHGCSARPWQPTGPGEQAHP